jgi:hypothetical protein
MKNILNKDSQSKNKMKLVSITWSYEPQFDYKNTILYKSFIKNNVEGDFINIHFNRNDYLDLEKEFENRYSYQFEFILYKIFLLKDKLKMVDDDVIVYCDTNDVVCLDNINNLKYIDGIIFSSEMNKYPNDNSSWCPVSSYSEWNLKNSFYLNSGLIVTTKELYLNLLETAIDNVLPLNYKNFGGDQGIYTYYYINNLIPKIKLDETCNHFLSTYLTSRSWYENENGRLRHKITNTLPMFVHDNGWNYGSPRIIEGFNLI